MKKNCGIAALVLIVGAAVGTAAQAAPPVNVSPALTAASEVKAERVRCYCTHRYRHHRRVVRVDPYYYPVYPAPPVGITFRKLFDAGFL